RLVDRERGGDIGVERRVDLELALPHLEAVTLGQPPELVFVHLALEFAAQHGAEQVAVADAVDLDLHGLGVDADDGDAALARAREHVGPAAEADERLAVAHIDGEVDRLRQRFLDHRRQAGAQRSARLRPSPQSCSPWAESAGLSWPTTATKGEKSARLPGSSSENWKQTRGDAESESTL